MKKNRALRLLSLATVGLTLFVLLIFITFPKYLFLDKFLSKNGVFLLPQAVNEGLTTIQLKNVTVYDRQSKIGKFDTVKLSFNPYRLKVEVKELQGFLELNYNFFRKSYSIKARNIENFEKFSIAEVDIVVDREIMGNLKVQNIKISGISLSAVNINFKGSTFDIEAKGEAIDSKGSGIIVINKSNPFDSALNGEIVDRNMKIIVSGTLKNLKFDLKPLL